MFIPTTILAIRSAPATLILRPRPVVLPKFAFKVFLPNSLDVPCKGNNNGGVTFSCQVADSLAAGLRFSGQVTAGAHVVLHSISWPLLSDAIDAAASAAAISGPPSMSRSTAFSSEESLSASDARHVLSHPHADIVLRSRDLQEFKVPKLYVIDSSPVLAGLIRSPSRPPNPNTAIPTDSATVHPVVPLTDSGAILTSLLSFIIPASPNLPSTVEECVELLWTAQKYEMGLVLTRIRDHVAQQN